MTASQPMMNLHRRETLHWNYNRYNAKLNNLYKTIVALGGWQPPDIIGVCEVENRFVLSELMSRTPLSKYPYRIIHNDSPDRRGIDVALLYNSKTVTFLQSRYINYQQTRSVYQGNLVFQGVNTQGYLSFSHEPLAIPLCRSAPDRNRPLCQLHFGCVPLWIQYLQAVQMPKSSSWVISMMNHRMKACQSPSWLQDRSQWSPSRCTL